MTEHRVLLISGAQGSGKTTLAKGLIAELIRTKNFYAHGMTLATPLYMMHDFCRGLLTDVGMVPPQHLEKKDGNLLQYLGTDWARRTYGDDVWVQYLKGDMENFLEMRKYDKPALFIVSDVRFRNEFDAFPEALRIRLECPEAIRKTRAEMWRENTNHPSEVDLNEYAIFGKFDMYLNTETMAVNTCVDLVMAQLLKNNWIEKRGDKK